MSRTKKYSYEETFPFHKCPVCGKDFIKAPLHRYKTPNGGASVCSWHCMRQARAEYDAKRKYKKKEV